MRSSEVHRTHWREQIAPSSSWASDTPRRLVDLGASVAIAAAIVDAVLTYALLDGSVHLERNPIIAAAMYAFGIAPTLVLATVLRVGIVVALAFVATRAVHPVVRYVAFATVGAVALWWCAIVFANAAAVPGFV